MHNTQSYLVDEYPNHVTLATLQRTESPTKVELNVVFLAFHTYSQKNTPACVEIEPQVMYQEIAESLRVKADIFSSDRVMLAYQGTITNADHEPERFLNRDIERLFPCNKHSSDQLYRDGRKMKTYTED